MDSRGDFGEVTLRGLCDITPISLEAIALLHLFQEIPAHALIASRCKLFAAPVGDRQTGSNRVDEKAWPA